MTHPTPLETRVATLISAYADRAATDVDPIAMTRIAAGTRYGNRPWLPFRPVGLSLGFAVVVMALLITIVAGVLAAGGQLLRRNPLSISGPLSVVAQYGKIHLGFLYIYEDGQAVVYFDIGATLPAGARRYSILARRLTQEGLDLVRSGAIDRSAFLTNQVAESAWGDPGFSAYAPTRYAICPEAENLPVEVARVVSRLPTQAQTLLRGKERTYANTNAGLGESPAVSCSEVAVEEAHTLVALLTDAGFHATWFTSGPGLLDAGSEGGFMSWSARPGTATEAEGGDLWIGFKPILPHGTWVFWGG